MFVKVPDGKLVQLAVDRHAAAAELFLEIEKQTGISPSDYKILYQGKWPVTIRYFIFCGEQGGTVYSVADLPATFSKRPRGSGTFSS